MSFNKSDESSGFILLLLENKNIKTSNLTNLTLMVNIRNKIVMKKNIEIIPYDKNNKNHPESQISLLVQAIDTFGFTTPLLIDKDNNLIAGHGRLEAGTRLGIKEFPCIVIDDLNESQIRALRISDNRIGELGETNWDNLKEEYLSLLDTKTGIEYLTGYTEEDFNFSELTEPEMDMSEVEQDYEKYLNAEVLKIVLYYDKQEYESVLAKLGNIMTEHDLKDNSEVILKLLENYENN